MAIELIGITSGDPEVESSTFVNSSVMAVVNNPGLEEVMLRGLEITDDGKIPFSDVQVLVQMSRQVRQASKAEMGGFREVVVYLGKKRTNFEKVGAIPYVGKERSVPIPFAGQTDAILTDLSPSDDILIVHLHPESPEASDEDLTALQSINRELSMDPDKNIRASLLIIGTGDGEEILHTYDSIGRYITINLEDLDIKEKLSEPLFDKLVLLKYGGDRFAKDADRYKPLWFGESYLYPHEIPGIGVLFPGYLNENPSQYSMPNDARLEEVPESLYVRRREKKGDLSVVYIEKDGEVKPLEREVDERSYSYVLNGLPQYSAPNSVLPESSERVEIPESVKIADYVINLTGGKNVHHIEILAIPSEILQF